LEVTFREHPLERKMREWVRERGSEMTVRVSGRSKKVKCLDRGILSTLARRWGAHFEEVNANCWQKSGEEGGVIAKMGGVKLQKSAGIFAIMSTTLHAFCKVSEIGVARVSGNFFCQG
jgi:uncharacterized membrane-anchored protein